MTTRLELPDTDPEFERFLLELATLSDAEIESRIEEASPELRSLLAEVIEASREEQLLQKAEPPPPRHDYKLGKIEKFLLVFMVRPGYSPLYPGYELHARSCALQSYYREAYGLSGRQTRNVRQLVPQREYNSLQVRFTKAMKRLEAKGLIEIFRVRRSRWFADRGRGPEPADLRADRLYLGKLRVGREYEAGVQARLLQSHKCCSRYSTVYRLSRSGSVRAHEIARRGGWYSNL